VAWYGVREVLNVQGALQSGSKETYHIVNNAC
jgi:hypothetical protein